MGELSQTQDVLAAMSNDYTTEQIRLLRVEAEESRRLAACFADRLSVIDLEYYASELEAEAAKLQFEQSQGRSLRTVVYSGHA